MSAEKAQALVLRTTDWSETSRIATLWTREFGKVRVLAKGGRRLKSNFENALDLLTLCRIVFLRKSSSSLDLLTEAQVVERFPRLRSDLPALYAAYYIAELLSDWTEDYDPHPVLFDEALATLRTLGSQESGVRRQESEVRAQRSEVSGQKASAVGAIDFERSTADRSGSLAQTTGPRLARFELVLLRELGYTPTLISCAVCGREMPEISDPESGVRNREPNPSLLIPDSRLLTPGFSSAAGGMVCPECRRTRRDTMNLAPETWQALRDLSEKEDSWRQAFSAEVRAELRKILNDYVTYLLGRRPRLLPYLGS
jgi:DNA repair protein RecO (recombination protein O)